MIRLTLLLLALAACRHAPLPRASVLRDELRARRTELSALRREHLRRRR